MDSIRQSIIERRDRLGWSNETLAEKSKVPLIIIQRFLEGSSCLDGYISQINSSLDEAIKSLPSVGKEQKQTKLQFSADLTTNSNNNSAKKNINGQDNIINA